MDENDRNRRDDKLDEEMERDAEIRRETAIRSSLGQPHENPASQAMRDEEGVPEFERSEVDDTNERKSER
jgi:hypothetical protein